MSAGNPDHKVYGYAVFSSLMGGSQAPPNFLGDGKSQRAPNPRPNLHRGTNLGVFVPIWPVMRMPGVVTGHIGTNTPKFVPSHWGRLTLLRRGCTNSVMGLELAEKAHTLFQHELFGLHPHRPILGPQRQVDVPHFLNPGQGRKIGTHINFFGRIFWGQNGVPNGPFSATKNLVYCFFPALSFWKVPGLPRKFLELPRKFPGDFPGSSVTVEPNINSNPEVPWGFPGFARKFLGLPRKFPGLPRKFPDFPGGQPLSLGSLMLFPDSHKPNFSDEIRQTEESTRRHEGLLSPSKAGIPGPAREADDTQKIWAHSEGHPHTERAFTGTLVNVGCLRRNSGECHGGSCEYGVVGSPKFAKVRESSHEA